MVFYQFFGVQKIIKENDISTYYIKATDGEYTIERLVTKDELIAFNSFKQQDIHFKHQDKRYYIHKLLNDEELYFLHSNKDDLVTDGIYAKELRNKLYEAINELKDIQKRRLMMYYFDKLTY